MEPVNTEIVEIIRLEQFDKKWWNDLVKCIPSGNLYQTTMWGDFHKKEYGMKPHYLLFKKKDKVCGLCLIIEERRGHVLLHEKKLRFLLPFLPKTYRIQNGPIIFEDHQNVMKVFLDYIKKNYTRFYCIHPNIFDKNMQDYEGFRFREEGTFLLETNDTERIWDDLKGKIRKDVKAAKRRDQEFFIEENLEVFEKIHKDYRKRNRLFPIYSGTYFKHLKECLKDNFMILGVRSGNEVMAYLCFRIFNDIASECYLIRHEKASLMKSGDFLTWKVIEWCCQNNIRIYDFCGFNPNPKSKKEEGIHYFKKKWGGKEVVYKRYFS